MKNAIPRMSSKLARIEPISEACTIRISFFTKAMLNPRLDCTQIIEMRESINPHAVEELLADVQGQVMNEKHTK